MRLKKIDETPAVLTSFAYRDHYVTELEELLITVREHHPSWPIVAGRGPVPGFDLPTLEVESPSGTCHWSVPVSLNLDGSDQDFFKIIFMKGWWMAEVWRHFGGLADPKYNRVILSDADARFNGPLDIELDMEEEVIACPWWEENGPGNEGPETPGTGLVLFQGAKDGPVATIVNEWSSLCLNCMRALSPQPRSAPRGGQIFEHDQDVLKELLLNRYASPSDYLLLKLDSMKYGNCPANDEKLMRRGLVDHWHLSSRSDNWPPPEEYRRNAAIGTPLPSRTLNKKP